MPRPLLRPTESEPEGGAMAPEWLASFPGHCCTLTFEDRCLRPVVLKDGPQTGRISGIAGPARHANYKASPQMS